MQIQYLEESITRHHALFVSVDILEKCLEFCLLLIGA